MFESENVHLLPMKGTIERETLRKAAEARRTRLIVAGIPGAIGSVLLPHEYEQSDFIQPDPAA